MLATAVSIDFDYFSRHSGSGVGGFMPLWFPGMGGAAEGGAVGGAAGAGGAAGEVGAAEGAAGAVGNAARGVGGAGEGAIAGAGTMAGYEAMSRGRGQYDQSGDDASPTNNEPFAQDVQQQQPGQGQGQEDVWGEDNDVFGGKGGGQSGGDGGGGGGGDGGGFDWGDWF